MSACPSENALLELSEGLLGAAEAEAVRAHADGCNDCRAVLAGLVASDTGPTLAEGEAQEPALRKGETIDRYLVLEPLGSGGMSVVHAAYDPQLNRRIAIKVLRTDRGDGDREEHRARLLREAQAVARLSHPNVVAVHDVGTVGERVYVAMELVDGQTLNPWVRQARREWPELLRVFTDAGRGLAAAHRAGLVHRDFKPDNVLIGNDGAVRVTDFGLARELGEAEVSRDGLPSGATEPAPPEALTRHDAIIGTPAYMAPEQITCDPVDARADQFSFCVALYEALYGVRPYGGRDLAERLRAMKAEDRLAPITEAKLPSHARRALLRGLSYDRAARHPSIEALLDALAVDPRARLRRRALYGAIALAVVAAIGGEAWLLSERAQLACSGAGDRLAGVWDGPMRQRIERALTAAGGGFGQAVTATTTATLDRYARRWIAERTDACEATWVRREQSEAAMDARIACLDERLGELRALTEVLAGADAEIASRAVEAGRSLRGLEGCRDLPALLARTAPADPRVRDEAAAINAELAQVKALHDAGKFIPALEKARAVHQRAEALGHPPALARASQLLGMTLVQRALTSEAERHLYPAISAAAAAHDDEVAAQAWVYALKAVADRKGRREEAELVGELARAAVARIGAPPELELARLVALARHAMGTARPQEGLVLNQQALELAERADNPVLLFRALSGVGTALCEVQRCAEAIPFHRRASELAAATIGRRHPEAAAVRDALAGALKSEGQFEEALRIRTEGAEVIEEVSGPDNLRTALALQRLGLVHAEVGNFARAGELYLRAHQIRLRAPERLPDLLASSNNNLALVSFNLGDFSQSERFAREALALYEEAYGKGTWNTQPALINLLGTLLRQGRRAEAHQVLGRIEKLYAALGPASPRRADLPRLLARVALEERRFADAVAIATGLVGAPRAEVPTRERTLDLMLAAEALQAVRGRDRGAALLEEAARFPLARLAPLELAQLRLLMARAEEDPAEALRLAEEGRAKLAPLAPALEVDRLRRELSLALEERR